MAQYIDKAEVVAEIKRLIRANELYLSEPKTDEVRFQKAAAYSVLNDLLHFLDTLEVKEVDLLREKETISYAFDIWDFEIIHPNEFVGGTIYLIEQQFDFKSYEEAVEAAIKYCLEILI